MNIVITKASKRKVNVGDIIKYEETSRRTHGFYMICHSEQEGYFVMSLTGEKGKLRFYNTMDCLLNHQSNIEKIYSKEEWELQLSKL
ncbi:TPA: hypothetical protein ACGXNJ_005214 [Bacillus cereus]